MTVKKYGIRLMNPVKSEKQKYLSYQQSCAEPIRAMMGGGEFSNADHL